MGIKLIKMDQLSLYFIGAVIGFIFFVRIAYIYSVRNDNLKNELKKHTDRINELEKTNLRLTNDIADFKNRITEKDNLFSKIQKINDESILTNLRLTNDIADLKNCITEKDNLFSKIQKINDVSILTISNLYSDWLTVQYSISEKYLKIKKHPAHTEAKRISELRQETKIYINQYKEMQYRYDALLNLFPEMSNYVEDFSTVQELADYSSVDDFTEQYDKSRDYLTKDEYLNLSVGERNQRALDNYINGRKSNWQIGRDYEMYCAYSLRQSGRKVVEFGIDKKFEDLGRDLISYNTNGDIEVIQCKYWSSKKLIHEKHIAQLYGTSIMFELENKYINGKVLPAFITNISLSETAKRFANKLGVIVGDGYVLGKFPRIKCNINSGNKIYHLPFDQQYDRTKIENDGEFYAFTVEEAVSKGFRRAFKHFGN